MLPKPRETTNPTVSQTMQDLIIQLITGALGGNAVGALIKKLNMGVVLNTVMGLIGGAGGAELLAKLGVDLGGAMANNTAGAAAGGGILMAVVGLIKNALAKKG